MNNELHHGDCMGTIRSMPGAKQVAPARDDKTADLFGTQKNETPLREQRGL